MRFTFDLKDKGSELQITVLDVCFTMKKVEGGSFLMWSQKGDPSGQNQDNDKQTSNNKIPVHQVVVDDFFLGETEVSQRLWEVVMGNNPSRHIDARYDLPVEGVCWYDYRAFIEKLNAISGMSFRLPTEAEWEYAAIGGKTRQRVKYSGSDRLIEEALLIDNSGEKTHQLKATKPNALGLYDMTGNVWEWCQDWYDPYDFSNLQATNCKVLRGGGWLNEPKRLRITFREPAFPECRYYCFGMRLALTKYR